MNQVHKENLTHVENANPGRQGLDIEIFGMEGVPAEIVEQHNAQVTQAHFAEAQERARLTGNPMAGMFGNEQSVPNKRPKVNETLEEIETRANQYREDRKNGVLPTPKEVTNPVRTKYNLISTPSPELTHAQTPPVAQPAHPAPPYGAPGYPPQGFPGQPAPFANGGALPPRPGMGAFPPGQDPSAVSNSIDDLIGEVTKETTPAEKKEEKKSKKDKNMKLIYFDENTSPEEKMAALPRFVEFMRT